MISLPLAAGIAAIVSAIIALVSLSIGLHTRSRVKRFEIEIREIRSSGIFINPNIKEVNISPNAMSILLPVAKGEARNNEAADKRKSEG